MNNEGICTLTGKQYRAALIVAPTTDVRYYLNGFLLSAKNREIVATDGHMLFCSKVADLRLKNDLIIEPVKIAASVETVNILENDKTSVIVQTISKRGDIGQFICRTIDGKFPDYKAVYPDDKKVKPVTYSEFSFGSELLARLQKIFGKSPLKFEMNDPNRAAVIHDAKDSDFGSILLMPCKV